MKYCPFCGKPLINEKETEIGIICNNCYNDFWLSEASNTIPVEIMNDYLEACKEAIKELTAMNGTVKTIQILQNAIVKAEGR